MDVYLLLSEGEKREEKTGKLEEEERRVSALVIGVN